MTRRRITSSSVVPSRSAVSQIEHAVRRFGQTTYARPRRTVTSIAEHRAIIEAVVDHDPERAEAAAIEHMRRAVQMMTEDV